MTHSSSRRSDLSVPIEQSFTLESRMAYSPSGQVFKAVDRTARASVALWISRRPLSADGAEGFLSRAEQIMAVAGQPEGIAFGLDPMQQGWMSFRLFSSRRVLEGRVELAEAERRWLGCVRAVERLHKAGLTCGDICLESFLLTSAGDVRFFGGFGLVSPVAELLAAMPSEEAEEARVYVAPEAVEQHSVSMSSDVFALAQLACRFFGGKPLAQAGKPLLANESGHLPGFDRVPPWFNGVILPLLACSVEARSEDASALIKALLRERTEVSAKSQVSQRRVSNVSESEGVVVDMPTRPAGRRWLRPAAVASAVLLGVVVGLGVLSRDGQGASEWARTFSLRLFGSQVSLQELQDLAASDDPMAHEALVRMARDAHDPGERRLVIESLLSRARRLGFARASELVRGWVLETSSAVLVSGEAPLALKALNPAIGEVARREIVSKAMQANRAAGAQLAAAIALDLQQTETFRPLFELAATEQARVQGVGGRSIAAVMAAVAPIRALYLTDLLSDPALTPSDTTWLMAKLGEQDEPNVKPVVALGLQNGSFKGPRRVFAEAITRSGSGGLSARERVVFVSCLTGPPTRANATALATSYTPEASRALFAILWLSDDAAVREAAMDGLFGKPLGDPSLIAVVEYIKAKKSAERDRYSKVFAAAGLSDLLTDEEFSSGFSVLRDGTSEPELIPILLQRAPPRVVFEVLDVSGSALGVSVYLDLLRHPSKEVRLEALRRLRNFNDATMFALVRQMYEDERDSDVRREYEQFLSS